MSSFVNIRRIELSSTVDDLFFGTDHFIKFMEERGWRISKSMPHNTDESPTFYERVVSPQNGTDYETWSDDAALYMAEFDIKPKMLKLYGEKNIYNNGQCYPLHSSCRLNDTCWANMESRKAIGRNETWSNISLPWVGQRYFTDFTRIAVIGINPNEGGGLDFYPQLIPQAVQELKDGKIRVNFGYVSSDGKKYPGTFLWHRVGSYVANILHAIEVKDPILSNKKPMEPGKAYDCLTFINHIKCSPTGDVSHPSNKMWENCGPHILKEELKILRPRILLVLGKTENIYWLNKNIFNDSLVQIEEIGDCKSYYAKCGWQGQRRVGIVVVPHPARYSSLKYIDDVETLTEDTWRKWTQL